MAFEQKPGSGALFKNDKKGNDNAPDYRGTANIGGVTFQIAGWIKRSDGKPPFMSLSIKEKEAKETNHAKNVDDDEDMEIPF